ncbi:MAG: phosphatidylserine decarboxylase [Desulfobacteraceae bacterium]|nr:MAG: phosphatidylserine decarboxylase [Desulfobacteraceae bacterium]
MIRKHQYIERTTSRVKTETLYHDSIVNLIYSQELENAPFLFRTLTSSRFSKFLGFLNYDTLIGSSISGVRKFADRLEVDLSECLDPPDSLNTARKMFERKIRYWETRQMHPDPAVIVSPADAKILAGSFCTSSIIFIKEKFFCYEELLGKDKPRWIDSFADGDFAIFRLTPEKYHYNHSPVSGEVVDIYEIDGSFLPCNPGAVMSLAMPFSKNRRVVTILDTDVEGGTRAGLVAMIEVAALMIGDIVQCYSEERYDDPQRLTPGMLLKKGQPKSLYRPGSSTDILIFQKEKVNFSIDIISNMYRRDVQTRFAEGVGRGLVETEVAVRSRIATVKERSIL